MIQTTAAVVDTPYSKEDTERLKRQDEETEIMNARIAVKLEEQGPPVEKEPMLRDDAEDEESSRTKFMVFCTADVPSEVSPTLLTHLTSPHL